MMQRFKDWLLIATLISYAWRSGRAWEREQQEQRRARREESEP